MRLVQGGSRRLRHLYIRAGYLAIIIFVLLIVLIGAVSEGDASLRGLAAAGAGMFQWISYLQVGLICILTPVFMAGAISQEANPRTWDIILTTPLSNLQVVLGNIFGRLFFILALLFSSLPLFAVTQYFGGVPGRAIFASYAIAAFSALLVAAIAVTLSITRTAGRRAVFLFYISVVMYLFVTYGLDLYFRRTMPIGIGASAFHTTAVTPLNPFLALEVLLNSNQYVPHNVLDLTGAWWLKRVWLTQPIAAFCWLYSGISLALIFFSTIRLRIIGAKVGTTPWYRRMFGLESKGADERRARHVGHNPIAWRESVARGKTLNAILGRWGFVALGLFLALTLLGLFHTGSLDFEQLRLTSATVVAAEIIIIVLIGLNMSATAVSREREDGTLDIILTTPIQPGPYIAGKLRGLVQFLLPMLSVPILTVALLAIYVLVDGFGREGGVTLAGVAIEQSTKKVDELPLILPVGAISLPLVLIPFMAFCVMLGLDRSIRSKGTIGSVVIAVTIVGAIAGVLSGCTMLAGKSFSLVGAAMSSLNPVFLLFAMIYPEAAIPDAVDASIRGTNGNIGAGLAVNFIIGSVITAAAYIAIVYAMHGYMKRTFMTTVRRLAGTS